MKDRWKTNGISQRGKINEYVKTARHNTCKQAKHCGEEGNMS